MTDDPMEFYAAQPRAIARAAGLRQFFPGKACSKGHVSWWWVSGGCVACSYDRKAAWVKANPDRAKAYGRRHYEENADSYKGRSAAWRKAHPERARELARMAPRNLEARRTSEKARRIRDPEKYRVKAQSRKAQRRGAEGTYTAEDVRWLYQKQRGRCALCPARLVPGNKEVDHIRPVIRGGSNYRRNLQLLCLTCNRQKGAKDPLVFAREKGLLL